MSKKKLANYIKEQIEEYLKKGGKIKKLPAGKAKGGEIINFNKLSQDRKKISQFNKGGIARACGAIKENKRKVTKIT